MAQAINSLPQSTLDTFKPISASAVHVLARLSAKKAVQDELRSQGVRVSLVKPSEISVRANEYLPSILISTLSARLAQHFVVEMLGLIRLRQRGS